MRQAPARSPVVYVMLEYFVCVVAVVGIGTLVFVSSLVVMLTREGIANTFRAKSRALSQARHLSSILGGRDLEVSQSLAPHGGGTNGGFA